MLNTSYPTRKLKTNFKTCQQLLLLIAVSTGAISTAYGNGPNLKIAIGESVLNVVADGVFTTLSDDELKQWITQSAEAVAGYYGVFPASQVRINLRVGHGGGVRGGKAFGQPEKRLSVTLGQDSGMDDLNRDWVLVHEMIHLAFPELQQRHHWLEEGLATYIESVARARASQLSPEFVWSGFLNGMPKGLPQAGDQGLDNTPTWGRTYWGGALFCMVADIEIRKQTNNQKSLSDAMSALVAAGLSIEDTRPIETVLEQADNATGLTVLMDTYHKMKDQPHAPDLAQLWKDLGVNRTAGKIVYNDEAPLAHVRKALFSAN